MKKLTALLVFILILIVSGCGGDNAKQEVLTVSGKKWTEQYILPYIIAEYVKANSDYTVEVKEGLGEVAILTEALKEGDIDLYVEYTGTGLLTVLKEPHDPSASADEILERVKKGYKDEFNLVWTAPLGFENTYALAFRDELKENITARTFSDVAPLTNELTFGAPPEFFEREDGYDGLVDTYNFAFKDTTSLDPNIMYQAVKDGQVDIIPAFTTDGRIARFNLATLKDDKQYFPPYYAAPIVRQEALDTFPKLEELLDNLGDQITELEMAEMNAKVDIDGLDPVNVAKQFLQDKGLIQ
ncbi:glycine/betaine ABC transporter substrate-binding protein [Bacillus sp. HMF5848]|uniref:ABC transporter substrate-binding protein n=1 Tax=Bacillus sp. HMF5848 TaxID=2495421 RepID=UPI000F77F535|nr:glycine betaine ABC transporter substrate-binding protein [Bacillus sp. HMF5848]RSK27154.1 glycine/betaine ABC transporter substrate-binding protein [Bacillus sp. HMF5848]